MDKIEWPSWVEEITVYRDGPKGQFCCSAWVDDAAFWGMGQEQVFYGWADTVEDAIRQAFSAGNAKSEDAS